MTENKLNTTDWLNGFEEFKAMKNIVAGKELLRKFVDLFEYYKNYWIEGYIDIA